MNSKQRFRRVSKTVASPPSEQSSLDKSFPDAMMARQELEQELARWEARDAELGYESLQASMLRFVLDNGRVCVGRPRPPQLRLRPRQSPFLSAFQDFSWPALEETEARTYTEGFAWLPGAVPMLHAWVVDADLRVIDCKLRDPSGTIYFGVPLDPRLICRVTIDEFDSEARSIVQHLLTTGRSRELVERGCARMSADIEVHIGPCDRFHTISNRASK